MSNACDNCNAYGTVESVDWCPSCKIYQFCSACMISEEHTGTFSCKTCRKDICNTYQMGPPDNPELYECWNCLVSRRQNLLITTLNKTTNNKIFTDGIDEINEIIKQVQESIPNNF